jgi:hypothetical protein
MRERFYLQETKEESGHKHDREVETSDCAKWLGGMLRGYTIIGRCPKESQNPTDTPTVEALSQKRERITARDVATVKDDRDYLVSAK